LCIGETEQEFASKKTKEVLARQLESVIARLKKNTPTATPNFSGSQLSTPIPTPQAELAQKSRTKIIVAYEPVYAIGSGAAPDIAHLTEIFGWLQETIHKSAGAKDGIGESGQAENKLETEAIHKADIRLVYGGSVTEGNAQALLAIPHVSGLLIGTASLDFQKFQNIVSSNNRS
jgi:triosephosphate isomerase